MSIEINVHLRSRAQPPGDGDLSRYASSPGSRTVWRRPVGAELTVNLGDPASVVEAVRASNEHLPAAEMLDNPTRGPSPSGVRRNDRRGDTGPVQPHGRRRTDRRAAGGLYAGGVDRVTLSAAVGDVWAMIDAVAVDVLPRF